MVVLVQLRLFIPAMFLVLLSPSAYASEQPVYVFGVISQRSPLLTAQYWNPIIRHVSEKSGVPLRVRIGKSGPETSEMIKKGEVDFMFSNHIFHPDNESSGYSVIARDGRKSISGQIVVPAGSKIKKLSDLKNKKVVFPSKVAFVGYMVPIRGLTCDYWYVDQQFHFNPLELPNVVTDMNRRLRLCDGDDVPASRSLVVCQNLATTWLDPAFARPFMHGPEQFHIFYPEEMRLRRDGLATTVLHRHRHNAVDLIVCQIGNQIILHRNLLNRGAGCSAPS